MENFLQKSTAYKSDVRKWSREQKNYMTRNIRAMTGKQKMQFVKTINTRKIKGSRQKSALQNIKLANSLKAKVRNRYGIPERVLFPFAQHGFYIAIGASRGHSAKKNPRKKIEWYKSVFDKGIIQLADIVAKHQADAVAKGSANLKV